jgi:hypothetical protein
MPQGEHTHRAGMAAAASRPIGQRYRLAGILDDASASPFSLSTIGSSRPFFDGRPGPKLLS